MGPYGTKRENKGPYGTIQDHTGPYRTIYGTIRDNTLSLATIRDHTVPYETLLDFTWSYWTIQRVATANNCMNLVQSTAYLGMFMKVAANMLGKTYTRYLHGLSWTCKQDQFFKEFFFFLLFTTIYLPNIYEDILHKCSVTRNQGTKRKFLVLSSESHLIWFKLQRKETLSRAVGDAPSLSLFQIEELCNLKKQNWKHVEYHIGKHSFYFFNTFLGAILLLLHIFRCWIG